MKLVLGSTGRNHKACVRKRVPSVVRFTLAALLASALLCVGWQPAFAQVSTGSISGSFADVQGGAIVGVTVKAVLVATNQEFTTISDSAGSFRLNALPIGIYRVEATKDGFKSVSVPGVEVAIAVDRGLGTIKLDLGEQTVSIEVSSGAPLVEQSEAQVTNTFSGAVLSTFSGVQENQGLDNIALFAPGVVSSRDVGFSNTNGGVGFSSNGLRGRNNDQESWRSGIRPPQLQRRSGSLAREFGLLELQCAAD
jgi:Carboxypeptidase regulatory-like domain